MIGLAPFLEPDFLRLSGGCMALGAVHALEALASLLLKLGIDRISGAGRALLPSEKYQSFVYAIVESAIRSLQNMSGAIPPVICALNDGLPISQY